MEPLAGMRAQLERTAPGADIRDGHAEALPVPPRSVDAVLVAEAFHWFATPATLAEITRVLRPTGGIGLLWNLEQLGDEDWVGRLRDAMPPPLRHPTPRATWDVMAAAPAYAPPRTARFEHAHAVSATGLADLVGSWSRVATRPAAEREAVRARLLTVAPEGVSLRYEALAVATRRTIV